MSRAARGLRPADGCEVLASREGQSSTGAAAWRCVVLTDRGRPYRGWWWRGMARTTHLVLFTHALCRLSYLPGQEQNTLAASADRQQRGGIAVQRGGLAVVVALFYVDAVFRGEADG